mgnify:CR=1 FL=1
MRPNGAGAASMARARVVSEAVRETRDVTTAAAQETLGETLTAGAGLTFEPRGTHVLKGVPGEWVLYRALAD